MATIVTVLGDIVDLYVETSEPLPSQVEVQFLPVAGARRGAQAVTPPQPFKETLVAVPSPLRPPPNTAAFASRIKFTVDLGRTLDDPFITVSLSATVIATSASGRRFAVVAADQLLVIGISVTTEPKLTRIMLHEFSTQAGAVSAFDPGPCEAIIALLTSQQRKVLLERAQANPAGRLVVFITLYDTAQKRLRMRADMFRVAVRPNATFTVFHCEDIQKRGITLVCHTEHFVVNFFNGSTINWITKPVGGPRGRIASEYMDKRTVNPIQYKLAAALPTASHDGAIYFVVCQSDGKSIMGKNYLHGIVNTHGCWMLFRNFNWPRDRADAFELLYRKNRLGTAGDLRQTLAANLYNDVGQPGVRSNSVDKWFFFDRNFAFIWFCHDIVGIQYFSQRSWLETDKDRGQIFPADAARAMNEHNTHQQVFEPGFPISEVTAWRSFQPGRFAYYDAGDQPGFKPTDALWGVNALGFRTSPGFAAESFPLSVPPARSWADLYFYKEDGVDVGPLSPLVSKGAVDVPGSNL